MNTYKQDGGPAFPRDSFNGPAGMTLRDWFAGQALNQATREIWAEHKFEVVAARCYHFADSMLEARK